MDHGGRNISTSMDGPSVINLTSLDTRIEKRDVFVNNKGRQEK